MVTQLRVLIWNLFHGRAVPPAGRDLGDQFENLIAGWEWDVALLQEVPPWWPPGLAATAAAEQRTALTSRNGLLALRCAAAQRWPDLLKSNGGGSNAVLSRLPIGQQRVLRLRRWPERRVAQLVRLDGGPAVVNLHASARPTLAREELAGVWKSALAWAGDGPLILGGDLNLRDPHAPDPELAGPDPVVHLAARDVDHLFARGLKRVGAVARPERRVELPSGSVELSDHPALVVELAPGR